jgi:rubrerythrin
MGDIREGRCPSCDHGEVIEAPLQQLVHYKSRDTVAPIGVAWHEDKGFLSDSAKPLNALHVYVCRSCGFTQMFTVSPGTIPIGQGHKTRLIKADVGSR